jgi:TolB-like protein/Tfp pilus assembly protein PilF
LSLFNELSRRNVLRVGAAYIVTAWLLIQVAETIFPLYGFGDAPARMVVTILAIGFIPTLIFSWVFEWTPQGFKRESDVGPELSSTLHTGKKMDRTIMLVLALALGYFAFDKFVLDPQRDVAISESATQAGVKQAREEARLGMFNDKSVAVLPFTNRSKLEEDEFFTDGMHDELLTRLSRISALKVISRTSVMRYRKTLMSIPDIAKELSVATILEGGVQRSGGQVRINVQLINAHTDEHLWAEIYDRELTAENLFAIQSEISTAIAESLEATLSPEEQDRVFDAPTENLKAYNHYLLGRQLFATRNPGKMQQAYTEFTRATELDPDFALAWVGVADVLRLLNYRDLIDQGTAMELRQQAVDKAILLNDQLGEAYTSLASLYQDTGEEEKAEAAYFKAIELNPNYTTAYQWYSLFLTHLGKREQSLQLMYKAAQLDPMSSIVQYNLADQLVAHRQEEEAEQVLLRLVQRDPEFSFGYKRLGWLYADSGKLAQGMQWFLKVTQLDPECCLDQIREIYIALGDYRAVSEINEKINQDLKPDSAQEIWQYYSIWVAQSNPQEGIDYLAGLPEELLQSQELKWANLMLYMYAGNFDKSYEWLLKFIPGINDPEQWPQVIGESDLSCHYAGIVKEGGDEALGREMLRFFMDRIENLPKSGNAVGNTPFYRVRCYTLAGSIDKAMDILEPEIARGNLISNWRQSWGKEPWFRHLEDHPRYKAVVQVIEATLAEQRALLEEMDEVGFDPP